MIVLEFRSKRGFRAASGIHFDPVRKKKNMEFLGSRASDWG